MADSINIRVNGRSVSVPDGITVAVALAAIGQSVTRHSVTGQPRGPVCGMGVCFECRVTIDGQSHQRGCQTLCREGMEVRTDG